MTPLSRGRLGEAGSGWAWPAGSGCGASLSRGRLSRGRLCSYKGRRGYHIVMHHLPPTRQMPASFPFDPKVWACGYACAKPS